MKEEYLYQQIANAIRRDILDGKYQSGDKLPPIRELIKTWNCTVGTAQGAYQALSTEGLVVTHVGKGTFVIGSMKTGVLDPLRRVSLIHRAEGFLLEVLTNGHSPDDVEDAVRTALDRWRVISQPKEEIRNKRMLRFSGSHDLAVAWMATHFSEIIPETKLQLTFSGSVSGLTSLIKREADLAGAHLWDDETDTYNTPFIKRLMPGIETFSITLAHRRIGLVVQPGNPKSIHHLGDLANDGVRFVNRQPGSGTRVWLEANLKKEGILPTSINGFQIEKSTHSDVAIEVANNNADVGIGLEAAARFFGLDFIFLNRERYDLILRADQFESESTQKIISWLKGNKSKILFKRLGGYDSKETGLVRWN
ncbi:MAG: GntR family transcriptional regulator [Chloroflexi bacterium]|nr:GntR family transcriptional regulator [Chloroflexota bacterium]